MKSDLLGLASVMGDIGGVLLVLGILAVTLCPVAYGHILRARTVQRNKYGQTVSAVLYGAIAAAFDVTAIVRHRDLISVVISVALGAYFSVLAVTHYLQIKHQKNPGQGE